ncbi:type II toxin-antitoxin system RelE/ParE family toxin [Coraliomargarita parva]|uniref:type II toxin-antitoxin system RelE/ParE family toxin n=1 Tax=Coraliomargarita parva TaxID=3014050 RepID=UPI0022B510FF|nr:type II toxin-antitoxin system RelE/ParE family toxin [Coraliomargarita parva]
MTPEARDDLRSIARYTLETWGAAQQQIYRDKLIACFEAIANGGIVARHFSKKYPDCSVTRCEHHYVFYLEAVHESPPVIIAVLHEKMDFLVRLKSRLG